MTSWWRTVVVGIDGPIWPCCGSWLNHHLDEPAIESKRNHRTVLALKFIFPLFVARLFLFVWLSGLGSSVWVWFAVSQIIIGVAFTSSHDLTRKRHTLYWNFVGYGIYSIVVGITDATDTHTIMMASLLHNGTIAPRPPPKHSKNKCWGKAAKSKSHFEGVLRAEGASTQHA